ncbi:hypothetical protein H2O64_14270 [Kordia sp. YSTF-M3]|uniref:Transglutaminase domain-containing protein n=1 Tax=Kordia aestuariivivens TaxID=2759037 RepID=A0ABR7QBY3_9FLAO|nr:hypothetical protein [Kordia aestuariivivens]MBC8755839.1 hypothetical protein [Kordia aestuariivivens]
MTNQKKPHGCIVSFQRLFSGCLALIATGFLLIILFFLATEVKIEGASLLVFAVSGFFVLRYLWKKVGRKSLSNKAVFKSVFFDFLRTVAVFVLFSIIMTILIKNAGYDIDDTDVPKEETTKTEIITTTEGNDVIKYIINKQYWKDFEGDWYRMDFKIAENSVKKSKTNREGYRYTRDFTWGKFYKHMADHDKPLLNHLYTSFSKIQKDKKMSRKKFAEFIITSIQNIQYNYIKSTPCTGTEDYPCVGNVRLGIFAPAEFGTNLKGDCDSRTVLLFVILAKFNFDVAILNSNQYKHSVLGINVPARGKYKTYNRKKYYFVETTAKGCPIGYLPKDVSTISYWDFVLVN